MNMLKFSFIWRCASVATVSKTIDDLPEPETPVKMVILRLGMRSETFLRLFSRAPRISMYSWGMVSSLGCYFDPDGTAWSSCKDRDARRRSEVRRETGTPPPGVFCKSGKCRTYA